MIHFGSRLSFFITAPYAGLSQTLRYEPSDTLLTASFVGTTFQPTEELRTTWGVKEDSQAFRRTHAKQQFVLCGGLRPGQEIQTY